MDSEKEISKCSALKEFMSSEPISFHTEKPPHLHSNIAWNICYCPLFVTDNHYRIGPDRNILVDLLHVLTEYTGRVWGGFISVPLHLRIHQCSSTLKGSSVFFYTWGFISLLLLLRIDCFTYLMVKYCVSVQHGYQSNTNWRNLPWIHYSVFSTVNLHLKMHKFL